MSMGLCLPGCSGKIEDTGDETSEAVEEVINPRMQPEPGTDPARPSQMTIDEFMKFWDADDLPLTKYAENLVDQTGLSDESKQFLKSVGVPLCMPPGIEFSGEDEFYESLAKNLEISLEKFDRYKVIGCCVDFTPNYPLCVDEASDCAIVHFDEDDLYHYADDGDGETTKKEDKFKPVFVNSSLEQLYHCSLAHEILVRETLSQNGDMAFVDHNFPPETMDWFVNRLKGIDSKCLDEGTYWSKILAEFRNQEP